jgi:hypothetical protein
MIHVIRMIYSEENQRNHLNQEYFGEPILFSATLLSERPIKVILFGIPEVS